MESWKKRKHFDVFCQKKHLSDRLDWSLALFVQKYKNKPVVFGKFGKTEKFSTENLDIHFIKSDKNRFKSNLDGFLVFEKPLSPIWAIKNRKDIVDNILKNYGEFGEYTKEVARNLFGRMPAVQAWNFSIVAALFFGMFLMTSIYRYLGQSAAAVSSQSSPGKIVSEEISADRVSGAEGSVLGMSDELKGMESGGVEDVADYVSRIMRGYENEPENKKLMREKIEKMVEGYPIEKMVPHIMKEDPIVAAFLVGIAKKESNWGKRVPVLDGKDCFNYWGYRGIRKRMGTGGHTCFDSREDAVKTVAKRINSLMSEGKRKTPKDMVVWKCGYDCSWDSPVAVKKWISDVEHYFSQLDKF